MNHRITFILIIIQQITIFPILAGEVRMWKPKELYERSEIVIIGQPVSINATGKKGEIRLGGGRILPTVFYIAEVRVVEVIKGEGLRKDNGELRVKEISIMYSRINSAKVVEPFYVHRFLLKKDGLFLLYLKPSKEGGYVASLNGEINDRQSAKSLGRRTAEQAGADQPATAPESKPEGEKKPKSESKVRSK